MITRKFAAQAVLLLFLPLSLFPSSLRAEEKPYFVTYDHPTEHPGDLEISISPVVGLPKQGNGFVAATAELEYGATSRWTTGFYLDSQSTRRDSTILTGFRWENRFRPLAGEHWINPVLYVEYENLSAADKTLLEVVGFGPEEEHEQPNATTRRHRERELETRLILSSNAHGWNIAENFIAEKSIRNEPWEFGYAVGVNRPLALAGSRRPCTFCRQNFRAGAELFGGLGTVRDLSIARPSHYFAPLLAWELRNGVTIRISPAFGLTQTSHRALIRFSVAYELTGFGGRVRELFR